MQFITRRYLLVGHMLTMIAWFVWLVHSSFETKDEMTPLNQEIIWEHGDVGQKTTHLHDLDAAQWCFYFFFVSGLIRTLVWAIYWWKNKKEIDAPSFSSWIIFHMAIVFVLIIIASIASEQVITEYNMNDGWKYQDSGYNGLFQSCSPDQIQIVKYVPGQDFLPDCTVAWYPYQNRTLNMCCGTLQNSSVTFKVTPYIIMVIWQLCSYILLQSSLVGFQLVHQHVTKKTPTMQQIV